MFGGPSATFPFSKMTLDDLGTGSVSPRILSNEISAPYEVPQFPIEQLEKKLAIQRQLSSRYSVAFDGLTRADCWRRLCKPPAVGLLSGDKSTTDIRNYPTGSYK
jgi:hypothetical protein